MVKVLNNHPLKPLRKQPYAASATLFKRDFNIGFLCEYCKIFTNSFFHITPPTAVFVSLIKVPAP